MEIVLAVLLLFGGFTLGSVVADKGVNDKQSATSASKLDDAASSVSVTQAMRQSDPTRCRSGKSVIYRDLTVPYRGHIEQPAIEVKNCERGRDCSYNPTAFPPSMEVKCPNE